MKLYPTNNLIDKDLLNDVINQEKQEKLANALLTSDTLNKLNISIESLPQKCQQTLQKAAEAQSSLGTDQLDPIAISLQNSKTISTKVQKEYEVMKLKQKNDELQTKINRNEEFLVRLREDLVDSRESMNKRSPNPETINDHIRQLKLKVASYNENCEKAKMKYTKLCVPDGVQPNSLMALVSTLASLKEEAVTLKQQAEDVTLAREVRKKFNSLRRQ